MATQKNTAREAVQAEPCQKQPDLQPRDALDCIALGLPLSAVAQPMPTLQQTMLLVTSYVEWSLEEVIKERCKDVGWDDKDVDVDFAVDLALTHVRLLRAEIPLDRSTFESKWFMAGSAVNLAAKTFSRPDSLYYRRLIAARRQFEVLFELLDFFGAEVGHAD